jgi:hypothetical protein
MYKWLTAKAKEADSEMQYMPLGSTATPFHRVKYRVGLANLFQATGTPKVIRKCIYIHAEEIKGRKNSPGCQGVGGLKRGDKILYRMSLMHDE